MPVPCCARQCTKACLCCCSLTCFHAALCDQALSTCDFNKYACNSAGHDSQQPAGLPASSRAAAALECGLWTAPIAYCIATHSSFSCILYRPQASRRLSVNTRLPTSAARQFRLSGDCRGLSGFSMGIQVRCTGLGRRRRGRGSVGRAAAFERAFTHSTSVLECRTCLCTRAARCPLHPFGCR